MFGSRNLKNKYKAVVGNRAILKQDYQFGSSPNVSPFISEILVIDTTYTPTYVGEELLITGNLTFRWDPVNSVVNTAINTQLIVDGVIVRNTSWNANTNNVDFGAIGIHPTYRHKINASAPSHNVKLRIQPAGNNGGGSWGSVTQIAGDFIAQEIHTTGTRTLTII